MLLVSVGDTSRATTAAVFVAFVTTERGARNSSSHLVGGCELLFVLAILGFAI